MVKCAVKSCKNYNRRKGVEKVNYFRFPQKLPILKQWIQACGQNKNINVRTARICSEHFTESDWKQDRRGLGPAIDRKGRRWLKSGAVPSQNIDLSPSCDAAWEQNIENMSVLEGCETYYVNYDEVEGPTEPTEDNIGNFLKIYKTEPDTGCGGGLEILQLREELTELRRDVNELKAQRQEEESFESLVSKILTKGQINRLKHPTHNLKWTNEDILSAISLYNAGPKAYKLLRKRNFPFPQVFTLRKWAAKLKLHSGILTDVIHLFRDNNYDEKDRLSVMSFAEMKLRSFHDYCKVSNISVVPNNLAQVIIIQGLVKNWKQIIYYDFECEVTAALLQDCIERLKEVNFTVVAVVSDMEPKNLALWEELGVNESKPFMEVSEGQKVFFFAHAPHIVQLLGDHFLNYEFEIEGTTINPAPLRELLTLESIDLEKCLKSTDPCLRVKKTGRQNLKVAAQLFFHSVLKIIRRKLLLSGKLHSLDALQCIDFIELVNDWFDIFSSSNDLRYKTEAYELALSEQEAIISSMNEKIQELRVGSHITLLPFQEAILLNNSSLSQLSDYIQNYNIPYIIASRLSLDELEHFFEVVRLKGGDSYPTPLELKYRLKSFILGHLFK